MSVVRTSQEPPRTASWRMLLPREHALWGWVGVPLWGAWALQPSLSTLLAGVAIIAGVGVGTGLGRSLRKGGEGQGVVMTSLAVSALLALSALLISSSAVELALVIGGVGTVGLLASACSKGRWPRDARLECAGIVGFSAVGAALAMTAGAPWQAAVALAGVIAAWQILGLWWVNRQLAAVLPRRTPWRRGKQVAFAGAGTASLLSVGLGHPLIALVPVLFAARVRAHAPAAHARDARRIGMAELGWALLAATAGSLAARLAL